VKRALVTGDQGFIGAHISGALAQAGYDVAGADLLDGFDVRRNMAYLGQYDVVVHCAAAVVTTAAKAAAGAGVAANLAIDAALFEWAVQVQPGRLVYFSSSCAYPARLSERAGLQLSESDIDLQEPRWPDGIYGWVKLTGEQLAAAAREAGVPVTVVRPFSVYGPGMKGGFAFRSFAEQVQSRADPAEIWGDASQVRDFIHVSDVTAAVMRIVTDGIEGPVNLGTGTGTSLDELMTMMTAAAGYKPAVVVNSSRPAGRHRLVADPARLNSFCPPQVTLRDYIAKLKW